LWWGIRLCDASAAVGKSCLLLRFVEEMFTPSYLSTIGIDFKTKVVEVDGERVRMRVREMAA
jgi:Ras-related protein Rab-8A